QMPARVGNAVRAFVERDLGRNPAAAQRLANRRKHAGCREMRIDATVAPIAARHVALAQTDQLPLIIRDVAGAGGIMRQPRRHEAAPLLATRVKYVAARAYRVAAVAIGTAGRLRPVSDAQISGNEQSNQNRPEPTQSHMNNLKPM